MKGLNKIVIAVAPLLTMQSCFFDRGFVEVKHTEVVDSFSVEKKRPAVNSVTVVNNQLVLGGVNLDHAKTIRITGPNGFDETFEIESQTKNNLIANGLRNISFVVGQAFSMILGDAHGSSTYQVTFDIPNGSITSAKLNQMGATTGQFLKWDGTAWTPSDLNSLSYSGAWDANNNIPDLDVGGQPGSFYIVSTAGAHDLNGGHGTDTWSVGDWAIWNENTNQWDKISYNNTITSFNSRRGAVVPETNDYTWDQIDKSSSSLADIRDVDITGLQPGQILKWDGSKWAASDDEIGSGGTGSVAGGVSYVTAVTASAPLTSSGGEDPNISISQATSSTDGYLSAVDWVLFNNKQNALPTGGTSSHYLRGDQTWQTLNTDNVPEGTTNQYFTSARMLNTTLSSFALDNSGAVDNNDSLITAIGKLQSQASDASQDITTLQTDVTNLQTSVTNLTSSTFNPDGSTPMEGDLDLDGHNIINVGNIDIKQNAQIEGSIALKDSGSNYVTLRAPATATPYTLTLPTSAGSNGYVLQTNGSGVLSWAQIDTSAGNLQSFSAAHPLTSSTSSGAVSVSLNYDNDTIRMNGSNALYVHSIASTQITGNIPLANITGLTNDNIAAAADIAWSKINKTGAQASDIGAAAATRQITAGAGLSGGGALDADRSFAVNVDGSTIVIPALTNTLQVADSGITTLQLANNAVTNNKIASGVAGNKISDGIRSVNASATLLASDRNQTILANASSSTITLPNPADTGIGAGYKVSIKNTSGGSITVAGHAGAATIDGNANYVLHGPNTAVTLMTDGSMWYVVHSITKRSKNVNCPSGYLYVPHNSDLATTDFCVMKYEARNVASIPTSNPTAALWNSVNLSGAKIACRSLDATNTNGYFDLISNPEWMAIARDIEKTEGQGNSAHAFSRGISNEANPNANATVAGTGVSKRTHSLSTGEEIWDFSGNLGEWVDWTPSGSLSTGPTNCSSGSIVLALLNIHLINLAVATELNSVNCLSLSTASYSPSYTSYTNASNNIGQFYSPTITIAILATTPGGAAIRGGSHLQNTFTGIYSLNMFPEASYSHASVGFRCVWRPNS